MDYTESATWVVRLEARAAFPEDYDGELDGYEWRKAFYESVQPRVLAAVLRELGQLEGWKLRGGNRGMASQDEVLLHLELDLASE